MPKNIVVLADGTARSGGEGHDTNVYKLFKMLENRSPEQVVFYDPGLGTDRRKLTGSVAGLGMSRNVLECYRFIFDHYQSGDRLFFFGFSRGAATVSSLSHFIDRFGILPASRPGLIHRAWQIYRSRDWPAAADFTARFHTMWTRVHFLGVWDTVAALGVPFTWLDVLLDRIPCLRHRFHRFDLSAAVDHGRHALAIDEPRRSFRPEIWSTGGTRTKKQVWFAGSHSNVGGGYADRRLSDIALQWMVCEAVCLDDGLRLRPGHGVALVPDARGPLHDPRARGLARLYRGQTRSWPEQYGPPSLHQSVLDRALWSRVRGVQPVYQPWILQQFAGRYRVEPWASGLEQPEDLDLWAA